MPQKQNPVFTTMGDTGLRRWSGYLSEEYVAHLRGRKYIEQFQEMADSPLPAAFLLLVDLFTRRVEWKGKAADKSEGAEREKTFLEECLDDMESPFNQITSEQLTSMIFGWAWSEILFKIRRGPDQEDYRLRSDYSDGRIAWHDMEPRSQDSWWRWDFEIVDGRETSKVLGMEQHVQGQGNFYVPRDKAFISVPRPYKRSPEGRSMLRPGWRAWFAGRKLEDIELIGVEREMAGMIQIDVPTKVMNESDPTMAPTRANWEEKIRKLRRGQMEGLLMPAEDEGNEKTGYRARLMTSGGSGRVVADTAIRRWDSRLLMSLLSEFFLVGDQRVGALNLAETKVSTTELAIVGILDAAIVQPMNKFVIPDLMRKNRIPQEFWPTLDQPQIIAPKLEEIADILQKLNAAGIVFAGQELEKWALSKIPGAPVPEIADKPITLDADPEVDPNTDPNVPAADTALNGAQVTAAVEIVSLVASGNLPRDSGVVMLQEFFNLEPARAERLMGEAGRGFQPKQPESNPVAPQSNPATEPPA